MDVRTKYTQPLADEAMSQAQELESLLHTALYDTGGETVEGAFVDHWLSNAIEALEALSELLRREGVSPRTLDLIRAAMRDPATPPDPLLKLLRYLGRSHDPVRDLVRAMLGDLSAPARVAAVRASPELLGSAVLLPLLSDTEPAVRAAAVSHVREAQEHIIAALDDQDPQVRAAAASAVRFTGAPAGGEAIAARFSIEKDESVRASLLAAVAETTRRAAISDGLPGRPGVRAVIGEPLVAVLLEGLRHPDPAVREKVAAALQRVPGADVARGLLARLRVETDIEVRRAITRWPSRNFHLVPGEALPLFASLLASDPDPTVRVSAADQMTTLGPAAAAPLLEALDSTLPGPRLAAARALRGAATLSNLPELARRLAAAEEPATYGNLREAIISVVNRTAQQPPHEPTPGARAAVQALIGTLAPDPVKEGHVRFCKEQLNALPVHANRALYLWAVRPDGAVFCVDLDRVGYGSEPENDPLTRFAVVLHGARRHDVLRAYILPPATRAEPCGPCRATGVLSGEECARCGGLGWLGS